MKTIINKKENPGTGSSTPFFKKERGSGFFDGTERAFFNSSHASVQRKCAHCEQEEKKQHKEENEEEEKEVQRKPIFESNDDGLVQRDPIPPPIGTCPNYDPNEVNRSRTAAGWLPQDFTSLAPDEFLFGDFGNNHGFVKPNALTEPLWRTTKNTFLTDGSFRIQIVGFSDCSGAEEVNINIRQTRAQNVERAFGRGITKKVSFRGMQSLGQFVTGNDTPENRARNRSVKIIHKQGFFFQPEAIANATESNTAIAAALSQLASSTDARERNVPEYIAHNGITVEALTPRHEGTVVGPTINFFPGTNYALTFTLPQGARFHVYDSNHKIAVQARNMPNITDQASIYHIQERIVQAVSEMTYLAAAGPAAAGNTFEQYKAQFNAWWFVMPYRAMMPEFDPALNSFGPRIHRAREIFQKIYAENATVKNDYDRNTGGIKEKIDTYNIPEGFNRVNSIRLQALRDVFLANAAPVTNAGYPAFKTAIETASAPLDSDDRMAVARSNDWQMTINRYITEEGKRNEIRDVIASYHGAPAAAPVAPAPAPAAGGGAATRNFLNHIRINGPASPITANDTTEIVTLTPRSDRSNPGVNVDTRFTVEPAARVAGNHISTPEHWLAGRATGEPAYMEISNSGTVAMTAHLDLLNLPAGVTAPTVPDYPFTINDNRQANLLANWTAQVLYGEPGGGDEWVSSGNTVRYVAGGQQFRVSAWFLGSSNPGLAINVVARLKESGVVVQNNTATPQPWAGGNRSSTPIVFNVSKPATVPAAGIPFDIEVDLLDAGGTVIGTKTVSFPVLDEIVYTQADAIRSATDDNNFFHNNSATGLLGIMTARGGLAARVAAAVNTADADGGIQIYPLTARHDSADYVRITSGNPDPSKIGYFVGINYANSAVYDRGPVGFYTGDFPALGSKVILLNRTTDIARDSKRSDDDVINTLVHEAIHAMDVRPNAGTDIEGYKTEFRAFWLDGSYGPPGVAQCPPGPIGSCRDAVYDPNMQAPGPKSPRARAIFNHLYNTPSYDYVKRNYDSNPDFRVQVDNYIYPDGINILASVRLERLRAIIEAYGGASFATLRTQVRQYMGLDVPAPAGGVLDNDEKAQIRSSRAWRDLVERKVTVSVDQGLLKGDLSIPVAP